MRISDWSSDVCSSDLDDLLLARVERVRLAGGIEQHGRILDAVDRQLVLRLHRRTDRKSVVSGKSVSVRVDLGGRRIIKKTNVTQRIHQSTKYTSKRTQYK